MTHVRNGAVAQRRRQEGATARRIAHEAALVKHPAPAPKAEQTPKSPPRKKKGKS